MFSIVLAFHLSAYALSALDKSHHDKTRTPSVYKAQYLRAPRCRVYVYTCMCVARPTALRKMFMVGWNPLICYALL